jgi:PmbA protein
MSMGSHTISSLPYEVFRTEETDFSLTFSNGFVKSKERSSEQGYGIRVLKAGRLGFSYCETEDRIPEAIDNAAAISRFSPKTGFSFAPKSKYPKMNLVDKKAAGIEAEELKGFLEQVRDGVERHKGKPMAILSSGVGSVRIENSEGVEGGYSATSVSVYTEAMAGSGFGFAYEEGFSMPDDFTAIGERAGKMAKAMRGAKKLKPGAYTVIFPIWALDELLYVLSPSMSGEWKRKGTSLLANEKGKRVFSPDISMYDDPLSAASSARPFDDEGTASRRIPMIEKGVLKDFIYDRETAALEGVDKSGFCSRAHFSSPPGASRSNTVISGGGYGNLEEELDSYVIVHSLHGGHTANTTTGDFGLEVNVAFHKAGKGRAPVPVRGFLLSGNVFKLLKGNLSIEKTVGRYGDIIAPRMAFEGVRVVS